MNNTIKILCPANIEDGEKAGVSAMFCEFFSCANCPIRQYCTDGENNYKEFEAAGLIVHPEQLQQEKKETFIATFVNGDKMTMLELTQDQFDVLKWMRQRGHLIGEIEPATVLTPTV